MTYSVHADITSFHDKRQTGIIARVFQILTQPQRSIGEYIIANEVFRKTGKVLCPPFSRVELEASSSTALFFWAFGRAGVDP